jgi:transmembrane sensor
MNSNEEKSRAAIAEQASEWFVANDEASLDARDSAALATWFKTSPVHIEEFLGVSAVVRDLKQARTNPQYSLEAILARARTEDEEPVQRLWPRLTETVRGRPFGGWFPAAATMTVIALLSVGLFLKWNLGPTERPAAPDGMTALHFETRHGEQLTQRLADNSVLHLNTESAVSIRYSKGERLVTLRSGQASFEVAHEASRAFRVRAGSADITDLGTSFDVRLDEDSTVITVVEGRVTVGPTASGQTPLLRPVELTADQQVRVAEGAWPPTPIVVDARRTTAWLHRKIVFDNEPLEQVAAEYNRYTATPIEIATPALRKLRISGAFATDDTDAFIAFLRSLKGVRVEVTATRIRVSGD